MKIYAALLLLLAQAQHPDVDAQVKALREALSAAVDAFEEGVHPSRILVKTAAELQLALDTAKAGQTIALVPGEYLGTFLLKQTALTDYVTVTTDGLTLPEARVPSNAGMAVL